MTKASNLHNQLKTVRTRLKLSQQELADSAGVTRQTISGIEAELYSASATVALRLARALGCRVEDLFWLDDSNVPLTAQLTDAAGPGSLRVALAEIDGRWVAQPLTGAKAFRSEMVPADGLAIPNGDETNITVEPLDDIETLRKTVAIAGCTPALSLWVRSAERWHPGLRVHWRHANSTEAIELLARREIHIGGIHFYDPAHGEGNEHFVRRLLPDEHLLLVNFGIWQEGLLIHAGNPKRIKEIGDLTKDSVRFVNREAGAGSRLLLDSLLNGAKIPTAKIGGYQNEVFSHEAVARCLVAGDADTGIGTAAVATAFGLDFVPLSDVRYDLALFKRDWEHPSIQQLLNTLGHRWVRSQLQVLGGYDTSRTGEIVAEIKP